MLGYGIVNHDQIRQYSRAVCDTLGSGGGMATLFLREIAAQETHSGKFVDRHQTRLGVGILQIDKIAFENVKSRTLDEDSNRVKLISDQFSVDLRLVEYGMLAYSPLLSMIIGRLILLLIPEPIPSTLELRAKYWKTHWNTDAGAGSALEFEENTREHLASANYGPDHV